MSAHHSAPKRPRLSLQIKSVSSPVPTVRTSRTLNAVVNPRSPTAFNTLSNVYSTAIDRSTPVQAEPLTAINTRAGPPSLPRLQTQQPEKPGFTPFTAHYPDTPLTAQPMSPAAAAMEINFPSTMTATPPLSAGPVDPAGPKMFAFPPSEAVARALGCASPCTPRRRNALLSSAAAQGKAAPYTHNPRSLHSILRNSPLPPRSAQTPISPRRQSLRLQEKAARRVGYNSPLTQTITTNKYTKSHIDLLFEEASPYSPPCQEGGAELSLDLAMAYDGEETRDGGQTPGPFEEMRRRMAGLVASSPVSAVSPSGGIRKRRKKEKKRRWVWTIGQEEDDADLGGALAAIKAAEAAEAKAAPQPSVSLPQPSVSPPQLSVTPPQLFVTPPPQPPPPPSDDAASEALPVIHAVSDHDSHAVSDHESIAVSIESVDATHDGSGDVDMSDTCSLASELPDGALTPVDMDIDLDLRTPTITRKGLRDLDSRRRVRLESEDVINPETGLRRDTPIPADLLAGA